MIVVTGGAGFIGSNLVAALCEREGACDVVVVDRFGHDDKWRNLAKHPVAEFVEPERLQEFLAANTGAIETIFHLGASSSTTERDVDFIVRNNFTLSLMLWRWCSRNGVPFIYASSAATYGGGEHGFVDDPAPEALARLRPLNPYGWSKHLFDRRVIEMVNRGEPTPPNWAGLKFFNVYGPNELHKGKQSSVVAQIHPRAVAGEPAVLFRSHREGFSDGGQSRDFIWVGDCVDVMLWLAETPGVSGLFNVGTGKARGFADLAAAVFGALDMAPRIDFIDTPAEIRERYQYFTEASMERLRDAGYQGQFTSLEEGVRRYVQDFLNNADDPYR
jgi:ADP-L-glycero-D-manno-heptose 6-epimerase